MVDFLIMLIVGFFYIALIKFIYKRFIIKCRHKKIYHIALIVLSLISAYFLLHIFTSDSILERYTMLFIMLPLTLFNDVFPDKKK